MAAHIATQRTPGRDGGGGGGGEMMSGAVRADQVEVDLMCARRNSTNPSSFCQEEWSARAQGLRERRRVDEQHTLSEGK